MTVYGARHFVIFVAAGLVGTVASLGLVTYGIGPWLADPTPLHDFFFERSAIQWVTLFVFCLAAAILVDRMRRLRQLRAGLAGLSRGRPPRDGGVAERLRLLSDRKHTHGVGAAAALRRELAALDVEQSGRIYGLVGNAVQLMLALGFLGTVWGISRALFGSFGFLDAVSAEQLQTGLGAFVGALGTALDTSVLGLVTGLTTTVASSALQWSETVALEDVDRLVAQALTIHTVSPELATPLDGVQSELTRIAASLMEEMHRSLDALATRCASQHEAALRAVVDRQVARLDGHEARLLDRVGTVLAGHVAESLRVGQSENEQLRTMLVRELSAIASGLQRVPEVSIRYPSTNGTATGQPQHA
jgi:Skp family chaperone for outer membrane proteins